MKNFFTFLKDIQVAYERIGSGHTIVLIHGFCEDKSMWTNIIEPLKAKFELLLIDLPGYGESTATKEQLSITWMAKMVDAILTYEKIIKCTMMGHSLGAYVSIHFAELYPNKLKGLGFINSHVYADDDEKKINRNKSIQFIEKHTAKLFIRELFNNLFTDQYKKTNPDILKKLIHNAQETISDHTIINTLIAMRDRADKSAVLSKLDCPVLFIIGKLDTTIALETSLNQTHLSSVNQVDIRENVAHMSVFEDTLNTINVITNFVNFCNN